MTHLDKQKLIEVVLYILSKTKVSDYYHIFKIIYFAHINHLAKYGVPLVTDNFYALPDGPVPSILYDCIKGRCYDHELGSMLEASISKGTDNDDYYTLKAKRKPDESYLSQADIEVLNSSIAENAHLSYAELRKKSHGNEWERAFNQQGYKEMNILGMAKDAMASDAILEYIKETIDLETALS